MRRHHQGLLIFLRNAAQLEKKIESLVNLIAATQGSTSTFGQLTPPENQGSPDVPRGSIDRYPTSQISAFPTPPDSTGPIKPTWESIPQRPLCGSFGFADGPCAPQSSVNSGPSQLNTPATATSFRPDLELQGFEGDQLLDFYRNHFAIHFPYVVIPAHITSDELRSRKPWLHRSIMMVASQAERPRQLQIAKEIVTDVATAMLTRGEKSLDMLQCMIIYNTWSVSSSSTVVIQQ